jgi:hypothetical protein
MILKCLLELMLGSLLLLLSVFYGYNLNEILNNRGLILCRNYFMIRKGWWRTD